VLHISNLIFLLFNTFCAISKTEGQIIAFRLLSGFGASATWAISPGIISDCFVKEERGQGIAVLGTVPLLAPALGPMAAAAMLGRLSWRYVFGVTSSFGAAVGILGYVTLRETYAPVILARRAARLRKECGDDKYRAQDEVQNRTIVDHIRKNINRAMLYLCTEPIVWLISFYTTASFGVLYLVSLLLPAS
jgi:MFS family permease